jgi:hypothetical protein
MTKANKPFTVKRGEKALREKRLTDEIHNLRDEAFYNKGRQDQESIDDVLMWIPLIIVFLIGIVFGAFLVLLQNGLIK